MQVYNLTNVFTLREKLCDGLVLHIGTKPTGTEFDRFVEDLYSLLPAVNFANLLESCEYLQDTELTKKHVFDLAWRLSGNLNKLKSNQLVYPWAGQKEPEWMPAQILSAGLTKTWSGDLAWSYKMRILAGSACPMIVWKIWTTKACAYISSKIGFSAPWKTSPYKDGHELVNTRFLVEIDAKYCRKNLPGFENINCPSSCLQWNKKLLKARAHIDPPCPYNFTHHCFQCPIGYDNCIAGTHPKTYQKGYCNICLKDTWHDPDINDICVTCRDSKKSLGMAD